MIFLPKPLADRRGLPASRGPQFEKHNYIKKGPFLKEKVISQIPPGFNNSLLFSLLLRRHTPTRLHGAISQKALIFILAAVRTWTIIHLVGFNPFTIESCVCNVLYLCSRKFLLQWQLPLRHTTQRSISITAHLRNIFVVLCLISLGMDTEGL
jgi:hypothetical protein